MKQEYVIVATVPRTECGLTFVIIAWDGFMVVIAFITISAE
jgi:hypothetical protein